MNTLAKSTSLIAGILAATTTAAASASLMNFAWTGAGSGTLNGVTFTNANFEINAKVNTANWLSAPFTQIVNTSASITISGVGTYNFTEFTGSWWDASGYVGFGRADSGRYLSNLYTMHPCPGVQSWDRVSPIGPVSGTGELLFWVNPFSNGVQTTGGTLIFANRSGISEATFTATAVPAPGALALVGLTCAFGGRRRRN